MKLSPKKRIMEAATRLFYEQGFNATGINQIIKESGAAKASFYEYFSSKEELGKKVLRSYQAGTLRWLRSIVHASHSMEEFVGNMSLSVESQIHNGKGFYQGCPVAMYSAQFPTKTGLYRDDFSGAVKQWEKVLIGYLEKQKSLGKFQPAFDPLSFTRRVLNLYEGSLLMWQLSGEISYIKEFKNQLYEIYSLECVHRN
ncbi:MAG: TetR/AcrR family transcriptional regulator [Leptospiraceae bacterium]|nr:TetR/AcrR family transcriptional regulator [Leptospiraceae bacterium]MCP5493594.1 TetR/AcrR family transcriptional regulator [Leptospiraceae bacterium]